MITPAYFREMAQYNRWQNGNVLPLLDAMTDAERNKDRGLFFKSLHRTFDHIAMCDAWFLDTLNERTPLPFRIEAHLVTLDRVRRIPRGLWVTQMFNHQTHHRSQLTTGLHMMGLDYGRTDVPFRPDSGF